VLRVARPADESKTQGDCCANGHSLYEWETPWPTESSVQRKRAELIYRPTETDTTAEIWRDGHSAIAAY